MIRQTNFGMHLRGIRKSRGLTQKELAQMIGITPITLCLYEQNKMQPPLSRLIRLCHVLAVTPNELLGFEQKTTEERMWT